MSLLWRCNSNSFVAFTIAENHIDANNIFKKMLEKYILTTNSSPLLDELITIEMVDDCGWAVEPNSFVYFTDDWLKELGLNFFLIKT
jgi:hypothetical protein